jgi:methylated-DNA-[protein]-cysteine S-methyltransferase
VIHSALGLSAIVAAPFGAVGVRTSDGLLVEMIYLRPGIASLEPRDRVAARTARQIERYLKDPDFAFDLPLAPRGSAFQQRVWHAIGDIPRGQVRSYGALARQLRTAPRAVGQACGANWFPLVIPCHRVVAAQGIGGFAGTDENASEDAFSIDIKRWLLGHEGVGLE